MNKLQLVLVWAGGAALAGFLVSRNETTYYIAAAAVVVLLIVLTFRSLRKEGNGQDTAFDSAKPPVDTASAGAACPSINIPGIYNHGVMTFKKDGIVYKGKAYNYNTITGVYYNSLNVSIHLIPATQSFYMGLRSGKEKMDFTFYSVFYIGHKKLQDTYYNLVTLARQLIEPWIIAGIVKDIFTGGKTVKIGSLEFSKTGYSKRKLFGGRDQVLWTDKVYIPQMAEGYVYVYKEKNGKAGVFATLSMRTINAVLLPGLVQACYDTYNGVVKGKTEN